jgi:hypothetical protein
MRIGDDRCGSLRFVRVARDGLRIGNATRRRGEGEQRSFLSLCDEDRCSCSVGFELGGSLMRTRNETGRRGGRGEIVWSLRDERCSCSLGFELGGSLMRTRNATRRRGEGEQRSFLSLRDEDRSRASGSCAGFGRSLMWVGNSTQRKGGREGEVCGSLRDEDRCSCSLGFVRVSMVRIRRARRRRGEREKRSFLSLRDEERASCLLGFEVGGSLMRIRGETGRRGGRGEIVSSLRDKDRCSCSLGFVRVARDEDRSHPSSLMDRARVLVREAKRRSPSDLPSLPFSLFNFSVCFFTRADGAAESSSCSLCDEHRS